MPKENSRKSLLGKPYVGAVTFTDTHSIGGLQGLDHIKLTCSAIPHRNAMPLFKKIPLWAASRGLLSCKCPAGCNLNTSVLDDLSVRYVLFPPGSPYVQVIFI